MLEATAKKLHEAKFFLACLERKCDITTTQDSETAEFLFSAFLSSARSVTFVLEAEVGGSYKVWSDAWRASRSVDERQLLARFTGERNRTLKRATPDLSEEVTLVPILKVRRNNTPFSAQMLWWGDSMPKVGVRVLKLRFAADGTMVDLVPACKQYIGLLEELMRELWTTRSLDGAA